MVAAGAASFVLINQIIIIETVYYLIHQENGVISD